MPLKILWAALTRGRVPSAIGCLLLAVFFGAKIVSYSNGFGAEFNDNGFWIVVFRNQKANFKTQFI